jgi:hypothetical protein
MNYVLLFLLKEKRVNRNLDNGLPRLSAPQPRNDSGGAVTAVNFTREEVMRNTNFNICRGKSAPTFYL